MPPSSPKRLRSEVIGQHRVFDVVRHEVADVAGSAGATSRTYDVFSLVMPDWVTVAACTADGRFVLVRQHRHGIDGIVLETPGGIMDEGETPSQTAGRELREETGYRPGRIESLGWVHPNPAIQGNRLHMRLALDCELVGERSLDEHEDTDPVVMEPHELWKTLRAGEIRHALSALTLERAFAWLSSETA